MTYSHLVSLGSLAVAISRAFSQLQLSIRPYFSLPTAALMFLPMALISRNQELWSPDIPKPISSLDFEALADDAAIPRPPPPWKGI